MINRKLARMNCQTFKKEAEKTLKIYSKRSQVNVSITTLSNRQKIYTILFQYSPKTMVHKIPASTPFEALKKAIIYLSRQAELQRKTA